MVSDHRELLEGVETTKGSIHFSTSRQLPEDAVRRIVQARRDEIDAKHR